MVLKKNQRNNKHAFSLSLAFFYGASQYVFSWLAFIVHTLLLSKGHVFLMKMHIYLVEIFAIIAECYGLVVFIC